ncbi:hypothetical protein PoB_002228300 [Plakobranchus ocellatus]|uniref:Uncharacterized protein n=1 Tax=Plakobranchus ocellatus TaxID=259542 RepID=A0AAV3ZLQ0_9GAST|nr:hypothetical protein PoB_002228300 [Plakobranchus ocellatus]
MRQYRFLSPRLINISRLYCVRNVGKSSVSCLDYLKTLSLSTDLEDDLLKAPIPALLSKIDAINALKSKKKPANQGEGQGEGENRPLIETKKDRTKGVMGKIRKLTGFDNRPIEDEDVMSTERLHFCVGTLEKRIQTLHNEFTSMLAAIKTLQSDYSSVRTQCSCSRYFSLKRIIEAAIEQTDAEVRYEFHP